MTRLRLPVKADPPRPRLDVRRYIGTLELLGDNALQMTIEESAEIAGCLATEAEEADLQYKLAKLERRRRKKTQEES